MHCENTSLASSHLSEMNVPIIQCIGYVSPVERQGWFMTMKVAANHSRLMENTALAARNVAKKDKPGVRERIRIK